MNIKKKWIAWTVAIVLATNLLTYYGTRRISLVLPGGTTIGAQQFTDASKFQKMFEVRHLLNKLYDGKIDDNALVEGAIKGMTAALNDPYTVFMNQKEYEAFSSQTEGAYSGVGIQIEVKENNIVVVSTFEDSPAKKAGILPGDVIEKVNGTDVTGKEYDKAVTMMKGKEGTNVDITVLRNSKDTHTYAVKRSKITIDTVSGEMLSNNIAYIKLSMFDENTGKNFDSKLKELKDKGAKGLVLDLRQNPGGLLTTCVDVVSNFIPKGKTVVSTVDKNGNKDVRESKGGLAVGMPLVVLTDGLTASASEIVSGAVRDYKIGTLVGEKTFGKGVVQTVVDTGDGTALKVTMAKYYTPNGENIHKIGIQPDVKVEYPEDLLKKPYSRSSDPQFSKALELIKEKMK
ncbi:S41 family peptidase [Clostridium sp. YIM B02515]|uniref:S41 family peptidase n=1 Tax=Clostridium rhizosphaerae TaxID=2803861 RepID=A0ABS1TD78_9CLOT|nr:S41 family peptidase [Clostridium rhizosphaerae]MBL4936304.1 S41 family peptidase [Clostridium rhizosphaerae]